MTPKLGSLKKEEKKKHFRGSGIQESSVSPEGDERLGLSDLKAGLELQDHFPSWLMDKAIAGGPCACRTCLSVALLVCPYSLVPGFLQRVVWAGENKEEPAAMCVLYVGSVM